MVGARQRHYYVDNSGDTVVELPNASAGTDTVRAGVSFTLGANVEKLVLIGVKPVSGTGNALNNSISAKVPPTLSTAAMASDKLVGGGGSDILIGKTGADLFRFNAQWRCRRRPDRRLRCPRPRSDCARKLFRLWPPPATAAHRSQATACRSIQARPRKPPLRRDLRRNTDRLWWDADGTGAGAAKLLATLSGVNTLSVSDFVIV